MTGIPINRIGRILRDIRHNGWLIRVDPFPKRDSAFYVSYFTDDGTQGFDSACSRPTKLMVD